MKRRLIILLSAGVSALILLGIFGAWRNVLREQSLVLRIADVSALLGAYNEFAHSNTVPQTQDLLSILGTRSITLHNPIPKVRTRPCYKIASTAGLGEPDPGAVVIEETDNIQDEYLRVRGYSDGSIRVERR